MRYLLGMVRGPMIPALRAPLVVPGAFFAVVFDPVERSATPLTWVAKDGADFGVQ